MSDKDITNPQNAFGGLQAQHDDHAAPWDDYANQEAEQTKTRQISPDFSRRRPVLITLDGRRVSERFILGKIKSVLGRDVTADVIICDGEVSRSHCYIQWKNFENQNTQMPECWIVDLHSTNGTYINGQLLRGEHRLYDGDMIRIGKTVLGFFLKDERVLELDQLLLNMALHDSLTGLYKREFFFSELHREFDRSRRHDRPLSVALLDIDHFKPINDQYGHLRGDEALRQFADLIRLALREGDISGRFGGEEFAVVFPETDCAGAVLAAERMRMAVEGHVFDLGGELKIRITTSVGIATMQPYHIDKMQLLDDADQALYKAKATGRNRTVVALSKSIEETHRHESSSSEQLIPRELRYHRPS